MSPDGLACGGVQHGTHHLVEGLVGVTSQRALGVLVDQAPAEAWGNRTGVQNMVRPGLDPDRVMVRPGLGPDRDKS